MRDWTKTLLPASFKGFTFMVESESGEGAGRRVVTHEYVRGESHDTEDMGRRAGGFSVKAYLASDAADAQASIFLAVLSSPEAGTLVLPMHGAMEANCTEVRTSSEKTRLGYISFDLRFMRAGSAASGSVFADLSRVAFSAAEALADIIPATLGEVLPGSMLPLASALGVAGEIAGAATSLVASYLSSAPSLSPVEFDPRVVVSGISRATTLDSLASQIAVITGAMHLHALTTDERDVQATALAFASSVFSAVPRTASAAVRNDQRLGQRIVQGLSLLACAHGAAAAAARGFKSRASAADARRAVVAAFDASLAAATEAPPQVVLAAQQSVAAAISHIDSTAGDLAPLVRIDLPRAMPSTLVAWALYRDPSRSVELVEAAQTGTSLLMPTTFIAPAR